ncbi:unnamed protein product [Ranitomeya imitator]|uniref:P2X purinoreceptor 7 intracellular domain-containing protein n=1 Tax=Ranitomeya imitator TaxID=111125 RepID=A0ABN9KWN3_9NEOB|nr:unnamed protein product [Ranitomeya imitator]
MAAPREKTAGRTPGGPMKIMLSDLKIKFGGNLENTDCFPSNPLVVGNTRYIEFGEDTDEDRIGKIDWCQCGKCVSMPTNIESICCKEISNAEEYMENINCITEHEYFYTFCECEPTVNILITTVCLDSCPLNKIINRQDGNQGKHRVTKRGPALSYPMFTLVTGDLGIVGRWRAGSYSLVRNYDESRTAKPGSAPRTEELSTGLHGFLCVRNLRSECRQQRRVLPCETDSSIVQGLHFFFFICNNYTTFISSKKRKTAYRAFTAWIHGFLGKGNRRPIPSCVVKLVREAFPEEHQEYMGFKLHYDNPAEFIFLQ